MAAFDNRLDRLERHLRGSRDGVPRTVEEMTDAELTAIILDGAPYRELTDAELKTVARGGRLSPPSSQAGVAPDGTQ